MYSYNLRFINLQIQNIFQFKEGNRLDLREKVSLGRHEAYTKITTQQEKYFKPRRFSQSKK